MSDAARAEALARDLCETRRALSEQVRARRAAEEECTRLRAELAGWRFAVQNAQDGVAGTSADREGRHRVA